MQEKLEKREKNSVDVCLHRGLFTEEKHTNKKHTLNLTCLLADGWLLALILQHS